MLCKLPGCVHVRIVDPAYKGVSISRRYTDAHEFLTLQTDDDVMSDIAILLTLTPDECATSPGNFNFEAECQRCGAIA
jgi:hypothetical protein